MQKRKKPPSAGYFVKLQKSKLCATRAPFAGLVQRFEIQIRIGSLTGRIACQSRTWITVGEGARGHSLFQKQKKLGVWLITNRIDKVKVEGYLLLAWHS